MNILIIYFVASKSNIKRRPKPSVTKENIIYAKRGVIKNINNNYIFQLSDGFKISIEENRQFIGFEIDPTYHKMCEDRVRPLQDNLLTRLC